MSEHNAEKDAGHVWRAVGPNAAELWSQCATCRADKGSIQGRLPCPARVTPPAVTDGGDA